MILRSAVLGAILLSGVPQGRAQTGDDLFRIPWGTTFGQMKDRFGLTFVSFDSVCTRYTSTISRVAGVKVAECILEFRDTAFMGAAVLTQGRSNSRDFLHHLLRTLGPGIRENDRAYQWLSSTTHAFYDEDSDGDGYVYWYSRTLSAGPGAERPAIRRHPPKHHEQRRDQ